MSRIEHYSLDVRWGARTGGTMLHDRLDRGREHGRNLRSASTHLNICLVTPSEPVLSFSVTA
jgi:hypothetical protein